MSRVTKPYIAANLDEPIIFRTTGEEVSRATLERGSLWLRSDQYYREIEDVARNDSREGVNTSQTTVPLRFLIPNGPSVEIMGSGDIGQAIEPHYILSMHGPSITQTQLDAFGSQTFGIRSISRLAAEILYRASLQAACTAYIFGKVYYQSASLMVTRNPFGSSPVRLGDDFGDLAVIHTDVLRKSPVPPFVEQDEWRIAVFPRGGYLRDDPTVPLVINVDPTHFYEYEQ